MKLDDDYDYDYEEEHTGKMNVTAVAIIISLFILLILFIVVLANPDIRKKKNVTTQTEETVSNDKPATDAYGYPATSELIEENGLTPDDLDFWNMYPKDGEETEGTETTDTPTKEEKEEAAESDPSTDPSTDGKHTLIEYADGTTEWVLINPYITKNTFDFTKLSTQAGLMKYTEDGKKVSFAGVDISKYQATVDFNKVKRGGIDFVMLRVGARGYENGQIIMDEYFANNIKAATEAGLDVGVYFYSQAITEDEAREEANVVLQNITGYTLRYPIAFDMETIENDTARTDALNRTEKTAITKAFLDTVEAAGYHSMIYGNKEWLLKKIDLAKLTGYDIWLAQNKEMPDYPYKFAMWQYSTSGEVDGIEGAADLNICFIDYSLK